MRGMQTGGKCGTATKRRPFRTLCARSVTQMTTRTGVRRRRRPSASYGLPVRDGFWIEPGVPLPDLRQGTTRPLLVGVVAISAGRAFLQRRLGDHPAFPGALDVITGFPHPGESMVGAIARLVAEETGWQIRRVVSCAGFTTWRTPAGELVETEYAVEVAGALRQPKSDLPVRDYFTWAGCDELDVFAGLGDRGAYLRSVADRALRDVANAPDRPIPFPGDPLHNSYR